MRFFGPVLFYDLVRGARGGRTHLHRCAYLLLLLVALGLMYRDGSHLASGVMSPARAARLAENFFTTFLGVQFVLAVLLTPAYTAGAVAEEKERRTLEYLLATDLTGREIVFGKLVGRLARVGLLLLAGLPVLGLVQFLGGVDPNLVLAGFAATVLTVLSLAGVGTLASVYARRARDAVLLTYLVVAAYGILCMLIGALGSWAPPSGAAARALRAAVRAFQAGNPFYALAALDQPGLRVDQTLPGVLAGYALFHGTLALVTVAAAVAVVRRVALREASVPGPRRPPRVWGRRHPIGDRPMVWKEVWHDRGLRLNRAGKLAAAVLVAGSLLPLVSVLDEPVGIGWRDSVGHRMNVYVRTVGTAVACLALVMVAVRAAASVRGERDRGTLDALLATPLTTQEVLYAKWLGSACGVRTVGLWLGGIWGLGVLTGGISPLAVPALVGVWAVYAGALAAVGLYFSVVCRSSVRAILATVLATLGLAVGHWLVWLCCLFTPGGGASIEPLLKLQAGCTPPVMLGLLAFRTEELEATRHVGEILPFLLFGTAVWFVLGCAVFGAAVGRFEELTHRSDPWPGERPAPPARTPPKA
jgi:ABC-type transport system involved in multi-copper enzyme maturation permease subunit